MNEFSLIENFFADCTQKREDVALAVGDDCALMTVPPGCELAVSIDTLVAGVHFTAEVDSAALGHKALTVGLSDLAAMGAEPAWATLALTLPELDRAWLAGFTQGLSKLARSYGVQLVGGDTTRGPLAVTMQLHGFVPRGKALRRDGARPGDGIYVTGTLGDSGLALQARLEGLQLSQEALCYVEHRLDWPQPRVHEALALRPLAHAAIDISDGLAADLGHILKGSGVGAAVEVEALPLSDSFRASLELEQAWALALTAGDDYELCVTAPAEYHDRIQAVLSDRGCPCTLIGTIEEEPGFRCRRRNGASFIPQQQGYRHF
ncbi:thiamine-phosphate kinase [Nitrosococcus oceani]|uniref:Thiamine-monophosphate kinase n=2 Tax=Nitrosococcus oceani TaxID=1229 RepID=Q3JCX9_NITOC|nr:thiamine-phosphate kinase [Nitrosococcus oceani]KFI20293.1 thiamine-monophosphate kinase [Nitrosococcus oceani C-27]ABA57317.1 thiamine-phosphate kinase [Nitrosococcus oceani ATCC 19707]EDZ67341.1 thiamine-monophosphate kinase [Nitrosococcus oceani AFC27]KFI23395.1 thiamine-monophosphate kinase [Nitrosococcus oceani]GEM20191.1 thiamine-monophosphate kinase [Nitrosococcus oceani]